MWSAETASAKTNRATGAGLAGSFVALLCCAGVAPVLGLLGSIGLRVLAAGLWNILAVRACRVGASFSANSRARQTT